MIVLDQFWVQHFHQIGLSGMIDGRADHRLATGKALTLRAVQGEGGFTVQIGLSGRSRHAQRSSGAQQFLDITAHARHKDCLHPKTARLRYYSSL